MNSAEFIEKNDSLLEMMIIDANCYASVLGIMDKYRTHIKETPKANQKEPAAFLSENDFLLEMMLKDFNCYAGVLGIMGKYRTHIEEIPKEKAEN